jgi:hypothetical protein
VSARTRHWQGYDCVPWQQAVRTDPPRMRQPDRRPPYQAWPRAHRFPDAYREWLTSPVPEIGPALFDALIRHRARADGTGPTAALRALLAEPHDLLDRALGETVTLEVPTAERPHRLLFHQARLTPADHDEDLVAESVAAALGAPACPCLDDLRDWQTHSWLRGHGWWLRRLATARLWRDAGAAVPAADPFIAREITPAVLARAHELDLTGEEVLRWAPVSTEPSAVRRWVDCGCTPIEALRLPGVTPEEFARWRAAGLDVRRTREARGRLTPEAAGKWYAEGVPIRAIAAAAPYGSPDAYGPLHLLTRNADHALDLLRRAAATPGLAATAQPFALPKGQ